MYSLLLVEDEHIIRTGLKKIILGMNLGIGNILEADGGDAATAIALRERPDMIITDIKMEHGDGLTFIRNIVSAGLASRTIILSGFSEFSFAQSAISMGVCEYLLKPIKKPHLNEALTKLISRIRSSTERTVSTDDHTLSHPRLRMIAQGAYPVTEEEIVSAFAEAGYPFTYRYTAAVTVYNRGEYMSVKQARDFIADLLPSSRSKLGYGYESTPGHVTMLIHSDYVGDLCTDPAIHSADISIGVSEYTNEPGKLPAIVQQSLSAVDFRLIKPTQSMYPYSELKGLQGELPLVSLLVQRVLNDVRDSHAEQLNHTIDSWFQSVLRLDNLTPQWIITAIQQALDAARTHSASSPASLAPLDTNIASIYRASSSIEQFITRVKPLFLSACEASPRRVKLYDSNPIAAITRYLEEHYARNISLQSAASQVFMNPNYFSSLFKKKTGISFVQYLQRLRIEKSKTLLHDPQLKIYEIAGKVGFADEKYYSKVFRSVTGMTPQEYRDS